MVTVVKFTRPNNLGYYCDKPDDQSGEYVPLAEYQILVDVSTNELTEMSKDMAVLRRLVERVVDLGSSLHADSIADVIYGKTVNTKKLIELLNDCKVALGEQEEREQ